MSKRRTVFLRNTLVLNAVIIIGILLIISRTAVSDEIKSGLSVCGGIIIPSLFPFMTLSAFAVESGSFNSFCKLLSPFTNKLFRLPGECFPALFFGFTGGYPVGAVNISELYKKGYITQSDAKHMISFCVNAGPAFIVTAVGEMTLHSKPAGMVILVSVCFSSLLTGIVYSFFRKKTHREFCNTSETADLSQAIVNSAYSSSKSIISVCTWIMIFSSISAIVKTFIKNEKTLLLYSAFSEVTTGITSAAKLGGIPLAAAAISFGGLCVMLQLLPIIKKCDIKISEYLEFRILNAVLSFLTAKIILLFTNIPLDVVADTRPELWSHTAPSSVALFIMGCILIFDITSGQSKKVTFSDIAG